MTLFHDSLAVVVDADSVEESNLHRQIIHATARTNMLKVDSAEVSILELNPNTKVKKIPENVTHDNIEVLLNPILRGSTQKALVCDCTDNQTTRYLISDFLKLFHPSVPLVSASAVGFAGQLTVINAPSGGCYRCLFPKASNSCQSCADGGVLGPVVGTMGTLQATEAIKVLVGAETLVNKLLVYDAFSTPVFRTVGIPPREKVREWDEGKETQQRFDG
jgi:adenylyltransferase/sulfurtransferase